MPTDAHILSCLMLRPCCGMSVNGSPHLTGLTRRLITASLLLRDSLESSDSMRLNLCIIANPMWGNCDLYTSYIGLRKLCHFLCSNDSKYCFLSCNCCSRRLNNGHLLILSAIFVFLHLSSNIRSIAANILMVVS